MGGGACFRVVSDSAPLLHKYIWKCQAKRYVNSYEDMESNEANDRLQEKLDYDDHIKREI